MRIVVLVVMVCIFSCNVVQDEKYETSKTLRILTAGILPADLKSITNLPTTREVIRVVNDSTGFKALCDSFSFSFSTDNLLKTIDFRTKMTVFVFMGLMGGNGYGITLNPAYSVTDSVRIELIETYPGSYANEAVTLPFVIGELDRMDKPISFSIKRDTVYKLLK